MLKQNEVAVDSFIHLFICLKLTVDMPHDAVHMEVCCSYMQTMKSKHIEFVFYQLKQW